MRPHVVKIYPVNPHSDRTEARMVPRILNPVDQALGLRRLRHAFRLWRYRGIDTVAVVVDHTPLVFSTRNPQVKLWFLPRYRWGAIHEPAVTALILQGLRQRPNGCFVDVGANIGWFTCVAARCQPAVQVYAFEMDDLNFQVLEENVRLNRAYNAKLYHRAVTRQSGTAQYRREADEPNPGFSLIGSTEQRSDSRVVEAVSLDDFFLPDLTPRPDVVKIDVEGAEMDVLLGMENLISWAHPRLFLEVHPAELRRLGATVDGVLDFLRGHGYALYQIPHRRQQALGGNLQLEPLAGPIAENTMLHAEPPPS
jgi:FkbM family methyltransferase